MDLIIRQAAIPEKDGLWDVAIQRGHIAAIVPRFDGQGREEIQADGDLLSLGFVDAHMHLDKSLVGENLPFFPASQIRLTRPPWLRLKLKLALRQSPTSHRD